MSELVNKFKVKYLKTKKSLGQHFLINQHIIEDITNTAKESPMIPIIEIGPGCGVLTEALYKINDQITVIDVDTNAIEFLNDNKDLYFPHINVIHNDILKVNLTDVYNSKFSIYGNLPYNISVKILTYCINYFDNVNAMIFMFQKEVAQRITAKKNTKDYSSLSLFVSYFYDILKVRDISGECFWPKANVMSTVLKFIPNKKYNFSKDKENDFFIFLQNAFRQKRKTLVNNLKGTNIEPLLKNMNIPSKIRAEQLDLEDFIKIYELIKL